MLLGVLAGIFISRLLPPRIQSTLTDPMHVTSTAQSEADSAALLRSALDTAEALRDGDYARLSHMVHPKEGVTFTPNTTVDRTANCTFTPQQIAGGETSAETYVWGTATDTAAPISMTLSDYLAAYVWDEDYLTAPSVSVDSTRAAGNALENVAEAYPDCRYVEFYSAGTDAQTEWSTLRLVYQWYDGGWYLVGVVHSSWGA